ncbi:hypothetical protein [Streptomyces sp. IBSBF 2806]|uniref:hypothetical protein n=1 Tax=Streptomyces sp. IBSBF 2806 TaxID=2903529 RepID=UPI002FDC13C8
MTTPSRLSPLLEEFDFARECLTDRMTGPVMDSGGDPHETLTDMACWGSHELLHHGAEAALLRDRRRARYHRHRAAGHRSGDGAG